MTVDETYITHRKKNKGGFIGAPPTEGQQTMIMGAVELDSVENGRKETGRSFLVLLGNKEAETFEEALRPRYLPQLLHSVGAVRRLPGLPWFAKREPTLIFLLLGQVEM